MKKSSGDSRLRWAVDAEDAAVPQECPEDVDAAAGQAVGRALARVVEHDGEVRHHAQTLARPTRDSASYCSPTSPPGRRGRDCSRR